MLPILAIVGPTGSGKTALSLRLAKKYQGEIINADTRQLYRDAHIGTNLPAGEWWTVDGEPAFFVDGIRHHLMACLSPQEQWSVMEWRTRAQQCVEAIVKRGHMPILVGGTGLYVRALLQGYILPEQKADQERRTELSSWPTANLAQHLQKISPERAAKIDLQNPRRLIRAIELAETGFPLTEVNRKPFYNALCLAKRVSLEERRPLLEVAIQQQFARGWVEEVKTLFAKGVQLSDPLMQAIGYREIGSFLQNGGQIDALQQEVFKKTWQYVRRQLTWFRKEPDLVWIKSDDEADTLVDAWQKTRNDGDSAPAL